MSEKLPLDESVVDVLQRVLQPGRFGLRFGLPDIGKLFPASGLFAFPANTHVVRRGESGKHLYLILTGKVAITKALGPAAVKVATFGPGEFFSEVVLMLDGIRAASAIATEDSKIFCIAYSDIETLSNRKPELGEHLTRLSSRSQAA